MTPSDPETVGAIALPTAPDPDRLAVALGVAERWLPAFCAGQRAAEDLYAEGVSTWHNVGEWEAPIKTTPSRRRRIQSGADLHVEDVTCRVFDSGFVVQATTVGTSAKGLPVRVPTVLIVSVIDGRIARFEEYTDSAAAEPLFEGSARDEHFDD